MAENIQSPIVVKKIKKVNGGHHGGSWKIAYADFVTALMAFFLLMWLLTSDASGNLAGIAEYFKNPLKVSMQGGSGAGGSNSILQGGGRTITNKDGQDNAAQNNSSNAIVNINKTSESRKNNAAQKNTNDPNVLEKQKKGAAEYEFLKKTEEENLKALEQQLKKMIESDKNLFPFKDQIMLDINTDGLRIQIVDKQNRAMFGLAKAELEPFAKTILRAMGPLINSVPNKIKISGHTDAYAFSQANKTYGNWELSAERANAARRELINGTMDAEKVLQVDGMGSALPFDKENPLNPINRRIAIVVMNIKAEARVREDQKMLEIIDAADAEERLRNLEEQQNNENDIALPRQSISPIMDELTNVPSVDNSP